MPLYKMTSPSVAAHVWKEKRAGLISADMHNKHPCDSDISRKNDRETVLTQKDFDFVSTQCYSHNAACYLQYLAAMLTPMCTRTECCL